MKYASGPLGYVSAAAVTAKEGDILAVSAPAHDSPARNNEDRDTPVVLLSAGAGITPMMAMLRQLAAQAAAESCTLACPPKPFPPGLQEEVISALQPPAAAQLSPSNRKPPPRPGAPGRLAFGRPSCRPLAGSAVADAFRGGPRGFMQAPCEGCWPLYFGLGDRIHQENLWQR